MTLDEQYNVAFSESTFGRRVTMAVLQAAWANLNNANAEQAAFAKAVANGSRTIAPLLQALMASQDFDNSSTDAQIVGAVTSNWADLAKAFGT
jgi:hypothetical protein